MTEQRPTSAELREKIVTTWAWPRARALFAREPSAESVLFVVGQFWADEAEDAVHGELLACVDRDPVWPACASYRNNPIGDAAAAAEVARDDDDAPPDDAFFAQQSLWWPLDEAVEAPAETTFLDDNGEMIVAFASFCAEGASQEDPYTIAFHPYCVFRRDSDTVEIVGSMERPEWENRWDVVDAFLEEVGASEATRTAPEAPWRAPVEPGHVRAAEGERVTSDARVSPSDASVPPRRTAESPSNAITLVIGVAIATGVASCLFR